MSDTFTTRYAALISTGKIEADPAEPALIKSVRGAGYLLAAKVTRE